MFKKLLLLSSVALSSAAMEQEKPVLSNPVSAALATGAGLTVGQSLAPLLIIPTTMAYPVLAATGVAYMTYRGIRSIVIKGNNNA